MKTQCVVLMAILAALVGPARAQTQGDAQQILQATIERMEQREETRLSAYAEASIERSVQRAGEESPTVVARATAKIWTNDPKYRVELKNEISKESLQKWKKYTSTGIQTQTIIFDGASVFHAKDWDSGEKTGIDYGRDYALPLIFSGFPSAHPLRPWTLSCDADRLRKRGFVAEHLNSGVVRGKVSWRTRNGDCDQILFLLPESFDIRRIELRNKLGELLSSIDMTWDECDGIVFVRRYLRRGHTASSQFPGGKFKDNITYEVQEFRAGVEIPDDLFTKDSLGSDRDWPTGREGGY